MCFSKEMSATFAALGLLATWWVWTKTSNKQLAYGIFYFFAMELLQTIQYFFIAPNIDSPICDTVINQFLTVVGFLHICLQPYFCQVINGSITKNGTYIDRFVVIKRLCLIGGFMFFGRFILSYVWPATSVGPSSEWIRGPKLCTYRGAYHLAWSVPMADPTYIIPGVAIHSFLMFAPFFALYEKKGMVIRGILMFVSGPYLSSLIASNPMEQASIWCFFSIAQIFLFLFTNRTELTVDWGRNTGGVSVTIDHKIHAIKKRLPKNWNPED